MNLLREIFERLDFERLISEGRDPVELLHYKFRHVPENVIDAVISVDPTKKKTYSQWLLSKWDDESDVITNNLRNGRIAKLFQHFKTHQEIQIKDFPSVGEVLRDFIPEEDTVLTKSDAPMTYVLNLEKEVPSELANDFDIVFSEDDWLIAVPNTYEASCKLGENMKWCTANAYGNGEYHYEEYLSKGGNLYVNFDMSQGDSRNGKDYPYTRYQFNFESRQFMDKENEPITLNEIGIPDSAIEFYENEGYDTTAFENDEVRWERYTEQRDQYYHMLTDDLYLNIAFDDDYEFTEPNERTDFYIFDENDERDPICWTEVANPNYNDVVEVDNGDNGYLILTAKYGDSHLLVIKDGESRYREWTVYGLRNYVTLEQRLDDGVFALDEDGNFTLFTTSGNDTYEDLKMNGNVDSMFLNERCSEESDVLYIETVEGEYHSLFVIEDYELGCIIHRDIPVNGKFFELNEEGLIQGQFKSYRPDGYYDEDEDEFNQYRLEGKLNSGDYIISMVHRNQFGAEIDIRNIIKPGSRIPLLDEWFDAFMFEFNNLYLVKKGDKVGYFTHDGQMVGEWYDTYSAFEKKNGIVAGCIKDSAKINVSRVDVISGIYGKVIGSFKHVYGNHLINGKVCVMDVDGNNRFFDCLTGQFCFPNLSDIKALNVAYWPSLFLCSVEGGNGRCIFNLEAEKVIVDGISELKMFDRFVKNYFRVIKTNGKENIFDTDKMKQIFENDVDGVISISEGFVSFMNGGRYYFYNHENGNMLINPNGFEYKPYVLDNGTVYFQGNNFRLYFRPDDSEGKTYVFSLWEGKVDGRDRYSSSLDKSETPQEVLMMYSSITGQQPAVTESFIRMVERMNNAMRMNYMTLID